MCKQFKKFTTLSALILGMMFIGSTGRKKEEAQSIDKLEMLNKIITTATWREIHDMRYTVTSDYDLHWGYTDCRKDDYRRFNTDGTGEVNEGLTKCNTTDPQSRLFQWRFLNKYGSRIEINYEEFILDNLDDTMLRISTPHRDPYASQRVLIFSR